VKTISTKVPEDLEEKIEEHREEGESRSAAVRRLVREGIDAEESTTPDALAFGLIIGGIVGIFLTLTNGSILVGALSVLAIGIGLTYDRYRSRLSAHD